MVTTNLLPFQHKGRTVIIDSFRKPWTVIAVVGRRLSQTEAWCLTLYTDHARIMIITSRLSAALRTPAPKPIVAHEVASLPKLQSVARRRCRKETLGEWSIPRSSVKPVLNWAIVCSPNILRIVRRAMIRFLTELLVHRTWFGQSKLYFVLNWLVMRCKLRPAADSMIENVG